MTRDVAVVMLVRNGARDLYALTSFLANFPEVIIVDDASTDTTAEVVHSQGWSMFSASPSATFAEKRTLGISAASQSWVLMLDCDERPTPDFLSILDDILESSSADGYEIKFRTHLGSTWLRHAGLYPLWVTRLFRRDSFIGFIGDIHERIIVQGPILRSDLEVDHFSYENASHYIQKINSYTDREVDEMLQVSQVSLFPPPWRLFQAAMSVWRTLRSRGFAMSECRNAVKANFKNRFTILSLLPLYPVSRFVYLYCIRRGFLDGRAGYEYASLSAAYSILKYAKFLEQRNV